MDEDDRIEVASPPCSLHELDPAFSENAQSVAAWRKAERKHLIAGRMALPSATRDVYSAAIAARLEDYIGTPGGLIISAYWPFRAEPDLRPLLRKWRDQGARIALPVVVAKAQPLIFREWHKGAALERGVWNIPFPAQGPEIVPDIAIAPVVGFDPACFRLGYGGGFFDRTMEKHSCAPRLIGVGYDMQAIPDIHPQAHDIAMECVLAQSARHTPG